MAMCNIQYVDEHGKAMSKQDFFRDFQIKNNVWTQKQFWNCCYRGGRIVCTVQWNKLYVKKIFENLRYPNGKVREDEFMIHHIINRCNRIASVNKKMYYYRQHTGSIMGNAYSINQLDIIEAYIERERSFRKEGKFLLAEKTLIRAILFLEWFEIGIKHVPQIDERYLNMKKIVCRECKIIIRSQSTVCFRLLFWMYSQNMLPYKLLRAIYWNVNRIKRKTALLISEKNISKVEKKQKKK